MRCPFCGHQEDRVQESRAVRDGEAIRRRRECVACGRRFTTYEQIEEMQPMVVKKDQRREPFDRNKMLRGMLIACRKRPVSTETLEEIANRIESELYQSGRREVSSEEIGEKVIEALHGLDQVAYVRFASVYRRFEDVSQFKEIVEGLGRTD